MLYFAYGALLDPTRLNEVAPNAELVLIAHLPETRLVFPTPDGLPSIEPAPGHTVWGAIFSVSEAEEAAISAAEAAEGREPRGDLKAVDRAGNKYEVVVFASTASDQGHPPSASYLEQVVRGARHWSLPTGWVVGLEELAEDALT
jgi:hypothetical protein